MTIYFVKENYQEEELNRLCDQFKKLGMRIVIVESDNEGEMEKSIVDIVRNH